MKLEKEYKYNGKAFQIDGFDYENEYSFFLLIESCQSEFSEEYPQTPANYLHMNFDGMQLIKKCFANNGEDLSNEIYGQEFVVEDMDKNFEINQKMDDASNKTLVYAISTEFEPDEPLCLIIDNSIADNRLVLKYISDSDDDNRVEITNPDGLVSAISPE